MTPHCSSPCRFLPKPPCHGGRRTRLCPALHSANPEVGRKRTREGEPPFFSLSSFSHCLYLLFSPRISLNTLTLNVKSEKVYTRHGVPISVTGIAQVKIQGQNKEMLAAACQMFLGKTEAEIAHIALETLEGHQRAIMAHMTVEEIYKDRQKFSEQVFKVASSDLVNMGISVVSYTLKDIHDDQDYLHSLGKARTAQVQKDARIGEAEAKRDAGIREAKAKQEKVSAQYLSEIEMAKAQRDYELKKAAYDIEVNTRRAQADLAYQLQVAKTKQQIEEQRVQVQVVERAQQVAVQEQEIARREKELEARVRKPAEAERYRLERLAEAEKCVGKLRPLPWRPEHGQRLSRWPRKQKHSSCTRRRLSWTCC
ncbi:flotillin-1 isoform X5 [Loxodonta africana]|uniref:flotillin-1 isoform X5 n=1 Tax=Loxodonta africana TaxID=9785 RepID=UPI000C813735|nr:flotillin-1 isoform X5 [Loxodonta africana]